MINVTIGESKTQSVKSFPKLMKSNSGRIVFMISCRGGTSEGFQLNDACNEKPHFCSCFCIEDFTDFNEPITIQNA